MCKNVGHKKRCLLGHTNLLVMRLKKRKRVVIIFTAAAESVSRSAKRRERERERESSTPPSKIKTVRKGKEEESHPSTPWGCLLTTGSRANLI